MSARKALADRLAAVKAEGEAEVAAWLEELEGDDGAGIKARVRGLLDERLDQRIAALLGMRYDTWQRGWVVDRGAQESIMTVALAARASEVAREWLDSALAKPVTLKASERKQLRDDFADEVFRQAQRIMDSEATDYADAIAREILAEAEGGEA